MPVLSGSSHLSDLDLDLNKRGARGGRERWLRSTTASTGVSEEAPEPGGAACEAAEPGGAAPIWGNFSVGRGRKRGVEGKGVRG
jgi:hypothetical protein